MQEPIRIIKESQGKFFNGKSRTEKKIYIYKCEDCGREQQRLRKIVSGRILCFGCRKLEDLRRNANKRQNEDNNIRKDFLRIVLAEMGEPEQTISERTDEIWGRITEKNGGVFADVQRDSPGVFHGIIGTIPTGFSAKYG